MANFKIYKKCLNCENKCKYSFSIEVEDFKCKKYKKKGEENGQKKIKK